MGSSARPPGVPRMFVRPRTTLRTARTRLVEDIKRRKSIRYGSQPQASGKIGSYDGPGSYRSRDRASGKAAQGVPGFLLSWRAAVGRTHNGAHHTIGRRQAVEGDRQWLEHRGNGLPLSERQSGVFGIYNHRGSRELLFCKQPSGGFRGRRLFMGDFVQVAGSVSEAETRVGIPSRIRWPLEGRDSRKREQCSPTNATRAEVMPSTFAMRSHSDRC